MSTQSGYVWSLRHFPQDTPYIDEDSEQIPAGYYVLGHRPDDEPENPRIIVHIDTSIDDDGQDARCATAEYLVAALNLVHLSHI